MKLQKLQKYLTNRIPALARRHGRSLVRQYVSGSSNLSARYVLEYVEWLRRSNAVSVAEFKSMRGAVCARWVAPR